MQLTLLNLVQDMLVATDGQNVTSIDETEESSMCINIANRAFEEMIGGFRWRHMREYAQLSTGAQLNELVLPSGTFSFEPNDFYYNDNIVYYLDTERFIAITIARDTSESNIEEINNVKVFNDRDPQWFTSFDDATLVFDTIPSASGLDATKSRALVYILPVARKSQNADVFDLPLQAFPALSLLCESKAVGTLKGDTQEAQRIYREYVKSVSSLARNARVIDILNDRRKHIVPRRGAVLINPLVQ